MAVSMWGTTFSARWQARLGALAVTAVVASGGSLPAAAAELTIQEEVRIGAREHALVLPRFGGEYADAKVRLYVKEVGERLVATLPNRPYDFRFTVLDSGDTYAFALPGGYVYITRQMLALANSEAELAAVLAHEIAHLAERHANQRSLLQDQLQGVPAAANTEAWHAFTREQEIAADAVSIRMLAAAGYDPLAQARFLAAVGEQVDLAQRDGDPRPRNPGTHPSISERVRRAAVVGRAVEREHFALREAANAQVIAGYVPMGEPERMTWDVRRDAFLGVIDGLVYGRRPSEGMILGNTYIDTFNRYSFTLPPGFRFGRTGRTISAGGPNGASMRFDMQQVRSQPTESMTAYLRRSVATNFELEQVQEATVGGMAAALGRAKVTGVGGEVAHVVFASVRVTSTVIFRFQFFVPGPLAPEMVERVLETPLSLRRITEAEGRDIAPMRVRVVTAGPETRIEALAAQMRMLDHPLDWLLTINQLELGAELAPGDKLKVIAQ
ncbi:MAG: hypothetical protein FJX64_05915 [Alphaproteobacteria bacterium]|nr:hypothetical protein [Alphaproteobacteria bacterium]